MQETVELRDGTKVLIRPMKGKDLPVAASFFRGLPKEDRAFLRRDVYRKEVVAELIAEIKAGKAKRLVAEHGGKIVAEGALELEGHSWKRHVGELRIVVGRKFQRKGLGMLMARSLYRLAAAEKIEELVVRMMRPQIAARKIFRRLGFHQETLLTEYVKDLEGRRQDLVVMRCDLEGLWRELEDYFDHSDWRRAR
jgi:L-amino acid N-acyltransferase YncA